jgi:predicted nucleotidyltransferase
VLNARLVTRVRDALAEVSGLAAAWVFGSPASGRAERDGNGDFGVALTEPGADPRASARRLGDLASRLEAAVGRRVDVVLLDRSEEPAEIEALARVWVALLDDGARAPGAGSRRRFATKPGRACWTTEPKRQQHFGQHVLARFRPKHCDQRLDQHVLAGFWPKPADQNGRLIAFRLRVPQWRQGGPMRFRIGLSGLLLAGLALGCGAATERGLGSDGDAGGTSGGGGTGGLGVGGSAGNSCGMCLAGNYTHCDSGSPVVEKCEKNCTPGKGCTACSATGTMCVGNDVYECSGDGVSGKQVKQCDATKGEICNNGECRNGCALAVEEPSNVGCEFFAVQLDLSDGVSFPGKGPWGVVLANAGQAPADVVIEKNDAPLGAAPAPSTVHQTTIQPGALEEYEMPVLITDCGTKPDDWNAPGTCHSTHSFRITSTVPIVVYQFNNLIHGYSTDASLLLPTTSLGTKYRVTGWPVAHSFPSPGAFVQRSYVTVIGTKPNTKVTVKPSWRIRGNGSLAATPAGSLLSVTLNAFDVLNLESDDATLQECMNTMPPYCADMTGTAVDADQPVAVFSGTEESGVGIPDGGPLPPSWGENSNGCCNQHLEEQLHPVEAFGKKFLVTRSPVRSNPEFTWWEEPDVLRFVGAAAPAQVKTNLPPPFDSFTLEPGQVKDTWSQKDVVVDSTEPIVVAQLLVGQGYVEPLPKGDPSFTIFPPVEQARTEYVFLSPSAWKENWVVIGTEKGNEISLDGASPAGCTVHAAGTLDGKEYEARRCPLAAGVHHMTGTTAFQIMAYGYSDADAYSFAGGADIKKIYVPPPIL